MTKKILFIGNIPGNDQRSIGGANTYTQELLNEVIGEKSIEIDHVQIRYNWKRYGQILDYIKFLPKIFIKIPSYDCLSIHATKDFHLTIGPFIVLYARIFNKKVIYHFFGGKFHKLYENLPLLYKKWIDLTIFKSDYKLMETKQMISFFDKKKFLNFVWFPNSRKPSLYRIKRKKFSNKFVFISRVTPNKGINEILQVGKLLKDKYIIDVYGPLEKCYNENDFEGKVSYKGVIKPDEVIKTLEKYDVLILPTYHEGEGYPGIFIEAMSLGIPIITTKWNALEELIEDNYNGKLIPIKSSKDLFNAISYFNSENFKDMSYNSLERFADFNIEMLKKKLLNLYHD